MAFTCIVKRAGASLALRAGRLGYSVVNEGGKNMHKLRAAAGLAESFMGRSFQRKISIRNAAYGGLFRGVAEMRATKVIWS